MFFDHSGKRWQKLRHVAWVLFVAVILVMVAFGSSLMVNTVLPSHTVAANSYLPINEPLVGNSPPANDMPPAIQSGVVNDDPSVSRITVYGFYDPANYNSHAALNNYINSIDVLIPAWFQLGHDTSLEMGIQRDIELLARENGVEIMPSITNMTASVPDAEVVQRMLDSQETRSKIIMELCTRVKSASYPGINMNFQGLDQEHKELFNAFTAELYQVFHGEGLEVTVTVPAGDEAYDYTALSDNADRVFLMLYSQPYEAPGPFATLNWSRDILETLLIPKDKLVVVLSNASCDWTDNSTNPASSGTFWDAMEIADTSSAEVFWDAESANPYLRYMKDDQAHTVWFLDGITFYNQLKISLAAGARGVALALGTEDPTVWTILSKLARPTQAILDDMLNIDSRESLVFGGAGEIMNISTLSRIGERSFQKNEAGFLTAEKYYHYPVPNKIQRHGKRTSKEVVLTFDDGPDPLYTPEILAILKEYGVKATFFVNGNKVGLHADILRQIFRDGHEIASHTFSHRTLENISSLRIRMEMNSTQRLIQQITGQSTALFRPPYITDFQVSRQEMQSLYDIQQMGYTMLGTFVDSLDWDADNADNIISNVRENLPLGNVILFHDGGGDRSNTVQALPQIIAMLQADGYTFITSSELAGTMREDIMPPLQTNEGWYGCAVMTLYQVGRLTMTMLKYFIYLAIVLGILRLVLFIYFSFRQSKRSMDNWEASNYQPLVSVVVAAYNEEKVICKTIASLLQSNYPVLEIIIVDDGSVDNTLKLLMQTFGSETRVSVLRKQNGGKASALNMGIQAAKGKIIIAIDADTVISINAISAMVRHFADKRVAAVSGNVKVGNVCNLLTCWQYIEYVTGFNLEKRSFGQLNCITVVPGSIGAWRKEAVVGAGGFTDDTLAEDTDMTLTLLQRGFRVTVEDQAIAYTEAPQDLRSFISQRRRWSYGILQCLWKHRDAMFNCQPKSLALVAIPSIIIFQYIFQALAPLADILFIAGLFSGFNKIILYYILFLVIDLGASCYAFRLEKERGGLLVWVVIQRFVYRWYMTYIVWISVIAALRGVGIEWNKLVRLGNVQKAA